MVKQATKEVVAITIFLFGIYGYYQLHNNTSVKGNRQYAYLKVVFTEIV